MMKFGFFAPFVWVYLNTTVRDRGIRRHTTGSYVPNEFKEKKLLQNWKLKKFYIHSKYAKFWEFWPLLNPFWK